MSDSNTKKDTARIALKGVTLSYPSLVVPKQPKDATGTPKYTANFLFPKKVNDAENPIISAVKAALRAAAVAKWGDKASTVIQYLVANKRICLKDGSTVLDQEGYDSTMMFISANSDDQPQLLDGQLTKVDPARAKTLFYPGAIVNAVVRFWALDHKDPTVGKRLCASLEIVQYAGAGKRIGHAPPKAEEYLEVLDAEELPEAGADTSSGEEDFF